MKPYPDAQVAHSLCSPCGPCKYSIKDGVTIHQGFLEDVAQHSFAVFGDEITEVPELSLIWAAFEGAVTVNGTRCSVVPTVLGDEIKQKWLCTGGSEVKPIKRISFSMQQLGDQLMIVPLCKRISATRDKSKGGAVPAGEAGLTGHEAAGGWGVGGVSAVLRCHVFPTFYNTTTSGRSLE
jgi:hypothetical protein